MSAWGLLSSSPGGAMWGKGVKLKRNTKKGKRHGGEEEDKIDGTLQALKGAGIHV